ncbi:MAG: ABC transporter permease [Thermoanaerobaculaceae bacterium]|nr:ABC transporter permease [Thermoanaerobaculaceae bacterium]MDI9622063.1 FtsX-like permease family protein [Acidobacteriota bacterium]NLH11629.1 ABC transporter permease [Holophagae bacterium]
MRLAWFLAARLLRKKGTALLRTSALAAMLAVGLGAASLIVVLAIMSGYSRALRDGILSAVGHITVLAPGGAAPVATLAAEIGRHPQVSSLGEVVLLPGLLLAEGEEGGEMVTVRAAALSPPFVRLPEGDRDGPLGLALGAGTARRLRASVGSPLALQVFAGGVPRTVTVRVAEIFRTGFVDLDEHWVVARLDQLRRRVPALPVPVLEVRLADPETASTVVAQLEPRLPPGVLLTAWQDLPSNRDVFAALRWQKISLAVVLSLVLGVGAFEVASAVVVLVTEKRRTVGLLVAMGSPNRQIALTLLVAGGALGCVGVLAGTLTGVAIVGVLRALGLPSFPPDIASIYMVERIPLCVLPADVLAVLVLGAIEVLLASLLPVRRVARLQPVEVLRWI